MGTSTFKTLFANRSENSSLPQLRFKEDNALGHIAQRLTETCHIQENNASDREYYHAVVDHFDACLDSEEYAPILDELNRLSATMAQQISAVMSTIKNDVFGEVTALTEQVNTERDRLLKEQGAEVLINDIDNAEPDTSGLMVLTWDSIDLPGNPKSITEKLHELGNVRSTDPSRSNLEFIVAARPIRVENITLNEAAREKIVTMINDKAGKLNAELGVQLLNVLCSQSTLNSNLVEIRDMLGSTQKNVGSICGFFETFIITMLPWVEKFQRFNLDLSEETTEQFERNLDEIKFHIECMAYYMNVMRDTLKDQLLLDKQIVNNDQVNEFKEKGGTLVDIVKYQRAFYSEMELPVEGIRTDTILDRRDEAAKMVQNRNISLRARMAVIRNEALSSAVRYVLMNYIKDSKESRKPEEESDDDYFKYRIHMIDGAVYDVLDRDGNIEDALYTFIIRAWHSKTILMSVYKKLRTELIRLAEDTDNVDEQELALADGMVVSEIVADFLIKQFCNVIVEDPA